MPAILDWIGLG